MPTQRVLLNRIQLFLNRTGASFNSAGWWVMSTFESHGTRTEIAPVLPFLIALVLETKLLLPASVQHILSSLSHQCSQIEKKRRICNHTELWQTTNPIFKRKKTSKTIYLYYSKMRSWSERIITDDFQQRRKKWEPVPQGNPEECLPAVVNPKRPTECLPSQANQDSISPRKSPSVKQKKWKPVPTEDNQRPQGWLGGGSPIYDRPKRSWKEKVKHIEPANLDDDKH
jgi:hypothetical protein